MTERAPDVRDWNRVAWGLVAISVGAIVLVDRAGGHGLHLPERGWPLIPLAFGLVRVAQWRSTGCPPRWTGLWMVFVGVWGLLTEMHVFGLDYSNSWPLLVMGFGGLLIAGSGPGGHCAPNRRRRHA